MTYASLSLRGEGGGSFFAFKKVMSIWASVAPGRVSIQVDELRISRAEEQAAHDSEEGRVLRRKIQKDALDYSDESFLLYGPGIDDSVWV